MEIEKLKNNLEELKEKKIYNYSNENSSKKSNYIRLFNCLYDKKQAYEFLLKHTTEDIKMLNEKLDPNNSTITYKDIQDTLDCVSFFNELKEKDNFEILEQVKTINDNLIKRFENFAEINESIIELNKNFDSPIYLFKNIKDIFTKANFVFNQDDEVFTIIDKEQKKVTIEELKSLKNKIHIKNKDIKKNSNNKENDDNLQQYNDKTNLLICFKNVVNNIEIIYDYMTILRTKGSSLPIFIKINIDYPEVKYYLNNKKTNFTEIQKFLFNVKNNIINKLDIIYRDKANLRFLYGKQFDSLLKHLDGNFEIDSIRRYILNNTNNEDTIIDGFVANSRNTEDYVYEYNLYNDNSFDNISKYIKSLFQKNGLSLENHYKNMLITKKEYKGIYLYESKNESKSMEDDILKIFLHLTGKTPIAQNILISNKETSYEEMQSFFYRAILCQYNTLFIVEINDSFSDYQQKIMNNFIDKLLNEKNQMHNEKENENIEKTKTEDYLDSCIIFIYKGNESFLDEIKKICPKIFLPLKREESESLSNKNIHIITSQVSGLGKTYKIKNLIKNNNKTYIYFPLGGNLTKNIIYNKLDSVLKKIQNKNDCSKAAIHLDLYENNEKSVLNEFLFCFLITKFYSNNENIIYIPKNIEIFIEIPNCFNNYISDYDILNSFEITDIKFENKPRLYLPKPKVDLFNFMLGLDTNKKIYEFIKKEIGAQKFSYHQINIFINLFISQYSKFNTRLTFLNNGVDVTEECINDFAQGTKYFTLGAFSKLLTEQDTKKKVLKNSDYIDLLSKVYTNDLKNEKYESPLIFIIKEKMEYVDLDISEKGLSNYKCSEDYLDKLKEILSLENPVIKDDSDKISLLEIIKKDDYIITNDNFKKMVLIIYRIKSNIPVIIMGEKGCGKTALILKLNQLLNDGIENVEIININPGINDRILIERMDKINKIAKDVKELWVFFDELNTCESLALLTEIFINRSYNGTNLENNIRIIGACNPYRKKRPDKIRCGLSYSNDENELIYLVNRLPQSLMYYVFNFGSIDAEDEKKYILSIISELFEEEEINLKEKTKNVISKCHEYLRETFDPSIVSLRELSRFKKCCKFLMTYFSYKNELEKTLENRKLEKIKSIIISIYLCYYIRLVDDTTRNNFDGTLKPLMIDLVNYDSKLDIKELNDDKNKDFLSKIEEPLLSDINNSISPKIKSSSITSI